MKKGVCAALVCLALLAIRLFHQSPSTLLSPQATFQNRDAGSLDATPQLQVYGFMPYWNLNQLSAHHKIPNTIIYSGITLDQKGSAVKDPGLANLNRQSFAALEKNIIDNNQQLHLSFTLFSTETIEALLSSTSAQSQAIQTIIDLVKEQNASGINLDFEPNIQVSEVAPQLFTQFVAKLADSLHHQSLDPELTIDIFGRSQPNSLWQLQELANTIDAFVLMAYDYHQRGSSVAGPVAPMFGSATNRWNNDIMLSLRLLRQQVSQEKIILGIPFYGYEWSVVESKAGSQTFPGSGLTATYDRVRKLMTINKLTVNWDTDALSPWLTLSQDAHERQIYFENQRSVTHKVALAQQAQLKGVAIWALGYEGETDDLWQPFANISTSKLNN